MAAVGALPALGGTPGAQRRGGGRGRRLFAALFLAVPERGRAGRNVARYQRAALAAMEGHFHTEAGRRLAISGNPTWGLALDNPIVVPGAVVPRLPLIPRRDSRPHRLPPRPVARQHGAALLRLPRDGGARDPAHRALASVRAAPAGRKALRSSADAVGALACLAVSLYRHHRRLDDRRARSTAVAGVRLQRTSRDLAEVGSGNVVFSRSAIAACIWCWGSCSCSCWAVRCGGASAAGGGRGDCWFAPRRDAGDLRGPRRLRLRRRGRAAVRRRSADEREVL